MSTQALGYLAMAAGGFILFLMILQFRKGAGAAKDDEENKWPFQAAREGHLMTDGEWHVYERLCKSMADGHVFAQVPLDHLLELKPEPQAKKRGKHGPNWREKIRGQIVDFVVCDSVGKVVAAVELGNASESQEQQKRSNLDKDTALEAAGIRVFRWTMRTLPKADEIRAQLTRPKVKEGEYEEMRDEDHGERLPVLS
jgi:hypothetical protein